MKHDKFYIQCISIGPIDIDRYRIENIDISSISNQNLLPIFFDICTPYQYHNLAVSSIKIGDILDYQYRPDPFLMFTTKKLKLYKIILIKI